jgi:hypothetical protein
VVVITLSAKALAILFLQNSSLMHIEGKSLRQNTYFNLSHFQALLCLCWKLKQMISFQQKTIFWMFDKVDPLSFLRSSMFSILAWNFRHRHACSRSL